jgi:hypothetical protein
MINSFHYKILLKNYLLIFIFVFVSGLLVFTCPNSSNGDDNLITKNQLKQSIIPTELEIGIDSVAMTVDTFRKAFTSPNNTGRELAMMYQLGVQDASEGRTWCDYKQLKSNTLREFVFEYLKKLPVNRNHERASILIEEALKKSFPCKK